MRGRSGGPVRFLLCLVARRWRQHCWPTTSRPPPAVSAPTIVKNTPFHASMNSIHAQLQADAGSIAKARLSRINKRRFADRRVVQGRRTRAWIRLGLTCKLVVMTLILVSP